MAVAEHVTLASGTGDRYCRAVDVSATTASRGRPLFTTTEVAAWRQADGSLVVEHLNPPGGEDPWLVSSITDAYAHALRERRVRQGGRIIHRFAEVLDRGPVLDYGCGQQAFLSQLLAAGYDAMGCDVGVPEASLAEGVPSDRFIRLGQPWAVPRAGSWTTIVLLDVLEHHPEPERFLCSLGSPRFLLVKVPLVTGPIGRLARAGVSLGRPALMETLLLAGDVSPHLRFFTRKGVDHVARAAGYKRRRCLKLADVGTEMPDRIRGGLGPRSRPARLAAAAVGAGLAATSPLWSDTAAFLYERVPSVER